MSRDPEKSSKNMRKQKVVGAFPDQSIEQRNDVTAVSGVNLKPEGSGHGDDGRGKPSKVNKEEGDKMRTTAPILASRSNKCVDVGPKPVSTSERTLNDNQDTEKTSAPATVTGKFAFESPNSEKKIKRRIMRDISHKLKSWKCELKKCSYDPSFTINEIVASQTDKRVDTFQFKILVTSWFTEDKHLINHYLLQKAIVKFVDAVKEACTRDWKLTYVPIWVGRSKFHANVARFKREYVKRSVSVDKTKNESNKRKFDGSHKNVENTVYWLNFVSVGRGKEMALFNQFLKKALVMKVLMWLKLVIWENFRYYSNSRLRAKDSLRVLLCVWALVLRSLYKLYAECVHARDVDDYDESNLQFQQEFAFFLRFVKHIKRELQKLSSRAKDFIGLRASEVLRVDFLKFYEREEEDELSVEDNNDGRINIIVNNIQASEIAQKAKIKWAIEGDENVKFFHGMLNKKRNQSNIRGSDKPSVNRACIDTPFPVSLSIDQKENMERMISKEETPFTYFGYEWWGEVCQRCKLERSGARGSRLYRWTMKLLSIGARLLFLKSVLGSIAQSSICRFLSSLEYCKSLDSFRYKAGFKGIKASLPLNRGSLSTWVWRFYSQKCSLWTKVIKAIYGEDGNLNKDVSGGVSKPDRHDGSRKHGFCGPTIGHEGPVVIKELFPRMFTLELNKNATVSLKLNA
ncbi:hypothetical protein Tco_0688393 [Tanacetum coccineum]